MVLPVNFLERFDSPGWNRSNAHRSEHFRIFYAIMEGTVESGLLLRG
jgi:hypothetical protein